jgi:hypothetical protein
MTLKTDPARIFRPDQPALPSGNPKISGERPIHPLIRNAVKISPTKHTKPLMIKIPITMLPEKNRHSLFLDTLLEAMNDPDPQIRKEAINYLIWLESDPAIAALIDALKDKDNEIKKTTSEALAGRQTGPCIDALLQAL